MNTKNLELKKVKKIAEVIHENGGETYFVGGFVRDRLLGKESKDIDIEIHGLTVQELEKVLSSFGKVEHIGAQFGILMIRGLDIDFCLPRKETKTGDKHTDFDVEVDPYIGTLLASKRRDFTINSIMENVLTGEIIDHFDGRSDLQKGLIRMVVEQTFQEDSLRVLRACQFASRFNFEIEEDTLALCQKLSFSHLSKERIQEEFKKGIVKGNPNVFFTLLKETLVMDKILPELSSITIPHFAEKEEYLNVLVLLIECLDTESQRVKVLYTLTDKKSDKKWVLKIISSFEKVNDSKTIEDMVESIYYLNQSEWAVLALLKEKMTQHTHQMFLDAQELIKKHPVTITGNDLIESGVKPSSMFHVELKNAKIRQIMTGWSNAEVLHSLT